LFGIYDLVDAVARKNVELTMADIRRRSTVLDDMVTSGAVKIVGAMDNLETGKAALARDSVYSAVMIISTGVVGACVLVGALRHREQAFRIEGAGPALAPSSRSSRWC
jgi:hypothetical protein